MNIGGISRKTVAIYGAINFPAINLLLQKMEQFYGAIIWYHSMAPFYGMCVPGIRVCQMNFASVSWLAVPFGVYYLAGDVTDAVMLVNDRGEPQPFDNTLSAPSAGISSDRHIHRLMFPTVSLCLLYDCLLLYVGSICAFLLLLELCVV